MPPFDWRDIAEDGQRFVEVVDNDVDLPIVVEVAHGRAAALCGSRKYDPP